MKIFDPIYGEFDITEPVILELLTSPSLTRLKGVYQMGAPPELHPHFPGYTRFEHSQGVMLLLRRLGASLEEQVAGLLHDVSHPAFSHTVDWVVGDPKTESLQDTIHEEFLLKSELPGILRKHGFDVRRIAAYERFSLLEQPAPGICADRLDYPLREFYLWADPEGVPLIVEALRVVNNRIVFVTKEAAERFARPYLKCQMEHWASPETTIRHVLLAQAVGRAFESKKLTFQDLFVTDREAIAKLRAIQDSEIHRILDILEGPIDVNRFSQPPGKLRVKKFRYVDPEFLTEAGTMRLSQISPDFAQLIETSRLINSHGVLITTAI